VYGLGNTLVAGDFLFCRAFALCARFEAEVIRWAAEACVALTEGEVLQGRFRRNAAVTPADYVEIIDRKTAALFAAGARTAAHLAGAPASVVEAMRNCGLHVGRAFQMQDDLLDVESTSARTGKPRGLDLRDGNPSLPIVLSLEVDAEVQRISDWRRPPPTSRRASPASAGRGVPHGGRAWRPSSRWRSPSSRPRPCPMRTSLDALARVSARRLSFRSH
jgi:geranylgeranyl pyrophosphate synthase